MALDRYAVSQILLNIFPAGRYWLDDIDQDAVGVLGNEMALAEGFVLDRQDDRQIHCLGLGIFRIDDASTSKFRINPETLPRAGAGMVSWSPCNMAMLILGSLAV